MKNIAIVTVNYNKGDSTIRLLKSLTTNISNKFELNIIVVDNGTSKIFELDKEYDNVQIIRPGENTGFSKGSNIGIREALRKSADYILLINNDTIVDQDLIENLVKEINKNEKIGIVSPKILFEKGKEFHIEKYKKSDLGRVIWYAGGYFDWDNAKSVHRGVDEVDQGQYDKIMKIDFATGCCMLIRSKIIEKIGLFDERYFLYYEDADLSMRMQNAGYEIRYVPNAFLYHENASSSGSGSSLHDYYLTRNQMIFGMRYAPLKTKIALIRQSLKLLIFGRQKQKQGIKDYYMHQFGMGSYFDN